MTNWKNIHSNFTEQSQANWEELGFNYQQTKEWIEVGLKPWESELASYLQNNNYTPLTANLKENKSQHWLDCYYPPEERSEITELHDIRQVDLEGCLIIANWPNLESILCWGNKLTGLTITNCPNLTHVNASSNGYSENKGYKGFRFTLANLTISQTAKLTKLDISNNNFQHDLSIFSHLTSLEKLYLNNNPFFGSLEPLKSLTKLKKLNVSSTNVNDGLEYLPESLKELYCNKNLAKILKDYEEDGYDGSDWYPFWRKDNQDLVQSAQNVIELENTLANLRLALTNQTLPELTDKALQVFIFQTEERIIELKKEIEQIKKQQLQAQIESFPKNYFL